MDKRLNILISNDDGIGAEGIVRLARMAAELGDVWVAAPTSQCSAMSQKLTIFNTIAVEEVDFPVPVRAAFSIDGTPADCVSLAAARLLPVKPDIMFSGINYGYNAGFDIAYSGTIGAATEAVMRGIPAIAFSEQHDGAHEVADKFMPVLARELMAKPHVPGELWNVNFPGVAPGEEKAVERIVCRNIGTLYDRKIAGCCLYDNTYDDDITPDGRHGYRIHSKPIAAEAAPEGSDARAVLTGYISVGKVKCRVMV